MNRSFVIAQISDLHLDASDVRQSAADTLVSELARRMAEFRSASVRVLLITGDIVDQPDSEALAQAEQLLIKLRAMPEFTTVLLLAGNHDVKSIKGLFGARKDVYALLGMPHSSEHHYFPQAGLDLVLVDSNEAAFAKGHVSQAAYDELVRNASTLARDIQHPTNAITPQEPEEDIVRVLALHHHALPLADGEGQNVLGIPDEPFMYLASPATFLDAAMSIETTLILHGHRHVQGLTRYSVPRRRATTSEIDEEFWRTVYVLSCPSSTGAGSDAGFNIIHFAPQTQFGRTRYRFVIQRYVRPRNAGAFELLDGNLLRGAMYLPLSRDFHRDLALQVEIELSAVSTMDRSQLAQYARRLLSRRAFFNEVELSWPHALYAYLATYLVWGTLMRLADVSLLTRDKESVRTAGELLWRLVELSAKALDITGRELDDLRHQSLKNAAKFVRNLPHHNASSEHLNKSRLVLLRELEQALRDFTGGLRLGGEVPGGLLE